MNKKEDKLNLKRVLNSFIIFFKSSVMISVQGPVVGMLWSWSCSQGSAVRVLWSGFCGQCPVVSVLWSVSCGQGSVVSVLWSVSCGQCPVVKSLGYINDQKSYTEILLSFVITLDMPAV